MRTFLLKPALNLSSIFTSRIWFSKLFSALQDDGKIITVGYAPEIPSNDFTLMRFNTDRSLDKTFNGTGIVITDFSTITSRS